MIFPAFRISSFLVAALFSTFTALTGASAQSSLGTQQNGVPFQACCESCDSRGQCSTCTDTGHENCGGGAYKANCVLFDDELTCKKASNIAPLSIPGTKKKIRQN